MLKRAPQREFNNDSYGLTGMTFGLYYNITYIIFTLKLFTRPEAFNTLYAYTVYILDYNIYIIHSMHPKANAMYVQRVCGRTTI